MNGLSVGNGLAATKIIDALWVLVVNILLFESVIQRINPFLAYSDEICCLFLMILAVFASLRNRKGRTLTALERISLFLMVLFLVVGVTGNIMHEFQQQVFPIMIDIVTCMKFFISIFSGLIVFQSSSKIVSILCCEVKILLSIMVLFAAVNLLFDVGMSFGTRFGLRSFMFVFPHPTALCASLVGMILLLLSNRKQNKIWIYIALALMIASLRSKGIAFVGLMALMMIVGTGEKKLNAFTLLFGVSVAVYFGWDQFQYYYGLEGGARLELMRASLAIANVYIPIGSGFATFGSNITANPEFYSVLYYQYGLSNVLGLQVGSSSFLSDTFWPTVIGQFGWLGLSLYIGILGFLIVSLWRRTKEAKLTLLVIALFGYLLISSSSESSFFNPFSVYLSVCFCLSLTSNLRKQSQCPPGTMERITSLSSPVDFDARER